MFKELGPNVLACVATTVEYGFNWMCGRNNETANKIFKIMEAASQQQFLNTWGG